MKKKTVIFITCLIIIITSVLFTRMRNMKIENERLIYEQFNLEEEENINLENLYFRFEKFKDIQLTYEDLNKIISEKEIYINNNIQNLKDEYNNNDIVGRIIIPDTSIDYPVVQYLDNDYYLERNLYGNYDIGGAIILDYENNLENEDKNTIIYGHNMKDDYMFHSIRNYRSQDYFNDNKYVVFETIKGIEIWEAFSFLNTHISFNYIQVNFKNDDEYYNLQKELKNKSIYDTGLNISEDDRTLLLSTCVGAPYEDNRYVLATKLIKTYNYDVSYDEVFDDIENNNF